MIVVAVAVGVLVVGLVAGFVLGSRNAHRMVARLTPAQRVAFARKVTAASKQ